MLYSEIFSLQWDNFINSFLTQIGKRLFKDLTVQFLDDWYKTNSFVWRGISDKEGVLLANEKNDALKTELLEVIDKFKFSVVVIKPKPKFVIYGMVGFIFFLGVYILSKMVMQKTWISIMLGIIVAIIAFLSYTKSLDNYDKEEKKRVGQEYAQQLRDYKTTLIDVCKKFE